MLFYLTIWLGAKFVGGRSDWATPLVFTMLIPSILTGLFWPSAYRGLPLSSQVRVYGTSALLVWISVLVLYFAAIFTVGLSLLFIPLAAEAIWKRKQKKAISSFPEKQQLIRRKI
jgi:hypothetical protein